MKKAKEVTKWLGITKGPVFEPKHIKFSRVYLEGNAGSYISVEMIDDRKQMFPEFNDKTGKYFKYDFPVTAYRAGAANDKEKENCRALSILMGKWSNQSADVTIWAGRQNEDIAGIRTKRGTQYGEHLGSGLSGFLSVKRNLGVILLGSSKKKASEAAQPVAALA